MIWEILVDLDVITPIVILVYFLFIGRRTTFVKSDVVLLFFLFFQLLINGAATLLEFNEINNHWIYLFNCVGTQGIFTWYFYFLVFNKKNTQRLISVSVAVFAVFVFFDLFFFEGINTFNSYSYSFGAFILCLYTIIGFELLLNSTPISNIFDLKLFWVLAGLLLYFGGSFLIFLTYNYLSKVAPDYIGILWRMHNLLYLIGCIFFAKSILSKIWIQK